jgi:hypothetical protein
MKSKLVFISVRFEVLTAVAMEITVLWDVTEYSSVDVCPDLSEERGSRFLRNVGKYLSHYTASHPRRRNISVFVLNVP